jgi:hypothetical protein
MDAKKQFALVATLATAASGCHFGAGYGYGYRETVVVHHRPSGHYNHHARLDRARDENADLRRELARSRAEEYREESARERAEAKLARAREREQERHARNHERHERIMREEHSRFGHGRDSSRQAHSRDKGFSGDSFARNGHRRFRSR